MAAKIAGIPKRISTDLLAFFPTKNSLKMLLKKWTTPVKATANSIGKNSANTGKRMVPNPKPEKNVRIEVRKATRQIMIYSIKS